MHKVFIRGISKTMLRVLNVIFIVCVFLIIQNTESADSVRPDTREITKENQSVLNVFTWVDYIEPEIFSDFEKEFRVKVNVEFYDDENVMFSAIQSEPGRFDITFPSDSMTDWMIEALLLSKLDVSHIPNIENLDGKFRNLINKRWKKYCASIDWGVTGIAYNSKYVKESVDSWGVFWSTKYKGRMALVNDSYEVMSVGQKRLNYPLNPTDLRELDEALKILKELKPLLHGEGFLPYDRIKEWLLNESLWIAQCYNGDAALINEENNNIKFVIPKEGTAYWLDNIAIPVGAKNKQMAEKFINFMLRPDIGARQANYSYYASCNKKTRRLVKKELLNNPYIYMRKNTLNKLETYGDVSSEIRNRYNKCWNELLD